MSNQQDSSKGCIIVLTSIIGVLGTIAVAYFAFRGNIEPKQLEIRATQTAESLRATQMANSIWITQTAQSIEAIKFAESIMATQTSMAASSNSTTPNKQVTPIVTIEVVTITPSPQINPADSYTDTPTSTIKTYVNVSTGFCLDSNSNGEVYALGCNGGNYQNWDLQGLTLVDAETHRCLDSNLEGRVYTLECNGGNYQNWAGKDLTLVNVATGRCLDSNANNQVYTLECNGGNYQNWK